MVLSRHYCFTSYIEPTIDAASIGCVAEEGGPAATYCCYQEEICPSSGRRHWQGYIEVDRRCSIRDVQRLIGGGKCHIERSKDPAKARDYCQKEETRAPGAEPVILGQFTGDKRGTRTDLATIAAIAREEGVGPIIRDRPDLYVRYHRGLTAIAAAGVQPRSSAEEPATVTVYIGATGRGKTRVAYDEFGDSEVYRKDASKWWDGYYQQKCILFDEWVGSSISDIPPAALLQILDRYPLPVQTKGGYIQMARRTVSIIFTSNTDITEWYRNCPPLWLTALPAFRRRVKTIVYIEPIEDDSVKVEVVDADAPVGRWVSRDEEEEKYP